MKTKKYYLVTAHDYKEKSGKYLEIIKCDNYPMFKYPGKYSMCSPGFDSRKELIKKKEIIEEPCCECGGLISLNYRFTYSESLRQNKVCFNCKFWLDIINETAERKERRVIVNGVSHYREDQVPVKEAKERAFLGFGGKQFKIKMNTGEVHITNNLWCQGRIPRIFRKRLPDNAKFINN